MPELTLFLYPEVPKDDAEVNLVWVDREKELATGINLAQSCVRRPPKKPMAIVGSARIGKSHLLRKIQLAIQAEFSAVVVCDLARGISDNRTLALEILSQFVDQIQTHLTQKAHHSALWPLHLLRQEYEPVITGDAAEITISNTESTASSFKAALSASVQAKGSANIGLENQLLAVLTAITGIPMPAWLLPLSLKAGMNAEAGGTVGGQAETTLASNASSTRTLKVSRFDEKRILKMVILAHQLALQADPSWKTLLVLDDFDLIQRQTDGQLSPTFLMQSLKELAMVPGLFVLTTVRQDTYADKDFYRLVALHPFQDDRFLEEIYQRHIKHWYDGNDPFQGGFVEVAAKAANGRVGLFLQALRDAWSAAGGGVSHSFEEWMREEWGRVERDEPELATLLRESAKKNAGILEKADAKRLRESIAAVWVLEDYTSTDAIRVNPILAHYLALQP